MAALTESQAKAFILAETNDDGTVADNWTVLWLLAGNLSGSITSDTDQGALLRYQFALVKACDLLLGTVRDEVSFTEKDRTEYLRELSQNLQAKRTAALTEISRLTYVAASISGGVSVGELSTKVVTPSPTGLLDANSDYYRGNPQRVWPGVAQ